MQKETTGMYSIVTMVTD